MGFYEQNILPHLIDKACSLGQMMKLRSQVVPHARGTVLEVGMGSGINLEFYRPQRVTKLYGLEPSAGMRQKAAHNLSRSPVAVEWLDLPGEQIPLPDNSVDTVLLTFTLCTIPDASAALAQMRRVLKPDGTLLFLEHGLAPDHRVEIWQHRINPVWRRFAGGCNLDRPISRLLEQAGFQVDELNNLYIPKSPKIASYIYQGRASLPTP